MRTGSRGSRVFKGPENYNLTQPGPRVFKPEPHAARHTSMNCLPEPAQTRPPTRLHCFPHTPVISCSGIRCASAPMKQQPDLLSTTPEHDDSQQTIYNLQPARNVFYKKRKPEARPDRLICVFFRPEPVGPVGFVGPARPVENSKREGSDISGPRLNHPELQYNLISVQLD